MDTVSITLFEEQVLQSIARAPSARLASSYIYQLGVKHYGASWGGEPYTRKKFAPTSSPYGGYKFNAPDHYIYTYPQINLTLGRLAQKGLVERCDWDKLQLFGHTAGLWHLTDAGKTLMGIE